MAETSIEWTQRPGSTGVTWNPTTGCDKISSGCDNCYALTLAKRLKGMGSAKYQTDGDPRTSGPGFGVAAHSDALSIPLRWRDPRTVFVNSMSDLFHAKVPADFVARVFAVMAATPRHTYQVLTKRPERMARMLGDEAFIADVHRNLDTIRADAKAPQRKDVVQIEGYPGYFVSNLGQVFSSSGRSTCAWCGTRLSGSIRRMYCSGEHRSKANYEQQMGRWTPPASRDLQPMSPDAGEQGHLRVTLYRDGTPSRELVHRLVLTAFVRRGLPSEQGRHLDGDPSNNVVSNLAWGTQADNWKERKRHGNHRSYAKLTDADVRTIRHRSESGEGPASIARDYPVTATQISNIARGRQWQGYAGELAWPLPGVWLGTSIESDKHVGRADALRATPAAVRFISAEPLLGPLPSLDLTGIDWLIIGGESGPGSRPLDLGWVRELIGKANDAGTAVFVKQLGAVWARDTFVGGQPVYRSDQKGGDWSHWPSDLRVRNYPTVGAEVAA